MDWTYDQLFSFVEEQTGEKRQDEPEGPAILGPYTVWRCWTYDGKEYHAHHVIAVEGWSSLELKRDFQAFANWLMRAFNATELHTRRLDWLRNGVAATITLVLLGLVVWAVLNDKAQGVDFRWLVGALATTSLGYLLGGWTRKTTPRREGSLNSAAPAAGS